MIDLALIALSTIVAALAFAATRRREVTPSGLWLIAVGAILASGLCDLLSGEVPLLILPEHVFSALYPALLLAGALLFTGRRVPVALVPAALGVGALRFALAQAGAHGGARALGLTFEPALSLLAAFLVWRHAASRSPFWARRALAPSLLAVAALDAVSALVRGPDGPLPQAMLAAWVVVVPLTLTIQIAAESHRIAQALRRARNRLEEEVSERTRELSESLAALRASEERYRTVSELSSDYSFAVRLFPDFSLRFEWVTDSMRHVTGYDANGLEGERWLERIPDEDRAAMLRRMGELASGESDEIEFRYTSREGEERWLALRIGDRRREADGSTRLLGTGRDVTELKRAERERLRLDALVRERQQLERLGQVAGGVVHDLSNALSVIRGHTQLALDELDAASPVRERLRRIDAVSRHVADLTAQMLTYTGKASAQFQPVELSDLVRHAFELLRASIDEKCALDIELAEDLPTVRADATQLRQVLLNVVGNASDASPAGGTVRIRTGRSRLETSDLEDAFPRSEAAPGEYVFLKVADDGPGMDAAVRARIFDPFFTTKPSGRGLGLAAVFGIVAAHGGVIRVESAPGKGTCFCVCLPVARHAPRPPASEPVRAPRPTATGTVLVVDDDEWVLDLAQELLRRAGFRVLTARDGAAAMDLMRRDPGGIDAVVLDLVMPEMNGEETLLALRELRPDLPAVLASGYDAADTAARFADRGFVRFVQKPYEAEELVGHVREALSR